MFVLEALVLTFMTTPLVTWLYPPQFRIRITAGGPNHKNVAEGETEHGKHKPPRSKDGEYKSRFTVVLDKFEHLSGMMAITQLINPSVLVSPWTEEKVATRPSGSSAHSYAHKATQVVVEALRVIELSDRVSAVMKSSAAEVLLRSDPLLSAFRMFGVLNDMKIIPSLAVVKHDELSISIAEHARNNDSDMILIPWLTRVEDPHQGLKVQQPAQPATTPSAEQKSAGNPFDLLFRSGGGSGQGQEGSASIIHSQFVRGVFSQATTDVALYVDQSSFDATANSAQHLFLPFFGGPDDRAALAFVAQLVENPRVSATIVRIQKTEEQVEGKQGVPLNDAHELTINSVSNLCQVSVFVG